MKEELQNPDNLDPKLPDAENPYQLSKLKITKVEKWAAGVPAVLAAVSDLIEDKAVLRGGKALFQMNQRRHPPPTCPDFPGS